MIDEYDDKHVILDGVRCVAETEKAIMVLLSEDEDLEEHWIPISQIHDDSEVYENETEGNLIITKWIAGERGLWDPDED